MYQRCAVSAAVLSGFVIAAAECTAVTLQHVPADCGLPVRWSLYNHSRRVSLRIRLAGRSRVQKEGKCRGCSSSGRSMRCVRPWGYKGRSLRLREFRSSSSILLPWSFAAGWMTCSILRMTVLHESGDRGR
ncbi:hypothetical protein VFPPC_16547 [Pochonia chlamydosporia 170]|uniref:Secreted protein n=1 Tax=Pochonia chlamydosporia 170 TaxID=1380566 RepID=A0A179F8A2_METCM|nr:hypothetical protein VFPPC_16547 [Pochonia chlamydosporia 170]OAQ61715.1 hypothetical protein VFPPC_16547 [Pochonia chlamydosporia 170]